MNNQTDNDVDQTTEDIFAHEVADDELERAGMGIDITRSETVSFGPDCCRFC